MRHFLLAAALLVAGATCPLNAADRSGSRLVAVLFNGTADGRAPAYEVFIRKMRELGWKQNERVRFEVRWGEGKLERLQPLAEELVRLEPALIMAFSSPSAIAISRATRTIPVVAVSNDPVAMGMAKSYQRPGGNVTGVASGYGETSAKQVEILLRIKPGLRKVAVLVDPDNKVTMQRFRTNEPAMRKLLPDMVVFEARSAVDLPAALARMKRENVEWLIVHLTEPFISERALIARLAMEHRIPTMFPTTEGVDSGGLMSYGGSFRETYERAAYYADRVLRGADPAALPIEFTKTVELGLNLATGRTLGISFPSDIVLRAEHVVN